MSDATLLAQMMRQASEAGSDMQTLRALAEEAGELGAARAIARLGLADEAAGGDVKELRQLLGAWRDAKRSALRAALGWVIRTLLALVVVGLVAKAGVASWLK